MNRYDETTRGTRDMSKRGPLGILLTTVAALCLSGIADAQTAGQLAQPSYAPVLRSTAKGGLDIPVLTDLNAPPGAGAFSVTPSGLSVEGGLDALAPQTAAIDARLRNHRVSGTDLFAAARDLEVAYARAGFVLARVTVPPQTLHDGQPLKLIVTQGYIERIDTSGLPERARNRVEAAVAPIVGKRNPTMTDLERSLMIAGDVPGLEMRSTLKAGSEPGTTQLLLDGASKPIGLSLSFDNATSRPLGHETAGSGADFNNLLGLGEVGYLRLSGYPRGNGDFLGRDPRNRQIVAGAVVPIGIDGWWVNLEAVDSRSHSQQNLGYTLPGHYQRFSTRLGWDWLRGRSITAKTVMSFDVAQERQDLLFANRREVFSKDRLRVLRLQQSVDMIPATGGALSGSVTLSVGLDALGARTATAAIPMSRIGAKPDFRKLSGQIRHDGALASTGLTWSGAVTAQTSFGAALPSSEQLGLGAFDWLSAFDGSTVQGDSGIAIRTEIAAPGALDLNRRGFALQANPYVFVAGGFVNRARPSAVEDGFTRAGSIGAGLRINLDGIGTALQVEFAHGAGSGGLRDDRINLRLTARF